MSTVRIMMNQCPISCYKNLIMMVSILMIMVLQYLVCADKATASCIESERRALLHFKAALVDRNDMLSSWKSTDDCCHWERVSCNNLTGHVQRLNLAAGRQQLSGRIHTSLLELQQLQFLNLSSNDFQDSLIPEFIGSMRSLRYLDLSSSNFVGKIPSHFGSLSHLKYLNLAFNFLEGSIPYQLGNLSKLQYLDLTGNDLQGTIPSQLGNLTSLQELYLGEGDDPLLELDGGSEWLSRLTSLTHLGLSRILNLNTSPNWLQMIAKLPKLRELLLPFCDLSDNFILSLCPSNFNFSTSLSVLDLSWNSFTSPAIFQWVSNVSFNLVELDLSRNLLGNNEISHFGILKGGYLRSLMHMCKLSSLFLRANNLTEDLQSILHNLSAGCVRHSLQELDLGFNQITGTLHDLSLFSSLKTLDLSTNGLSGKIPEGTELPPKLESLSIFKLFTRWNSKIFWEHLYFELVGLI